MTLDLNAQFIEILDILENTKKNLFITGKAGTGKSTLLNYFRDTTKKNIVVLAPTGVAAVNVKGETIHSYFHFRPNISDEEVKNIAKKYINSEIYANLNTVVIDEVSMVRADLLDNVDLFLRVSRKIDRPFGGVQMVFIGDLFQLPPVVTGDEGSQFLFMYKSPYFFNSYAMAQMLSDKDNFCTFELEKIYRQTEDDFINLLNSIRNNSVTDKEIELINKRCSNEDLSDMENHIWIVSTNKQAEAINNMKLESLEAEKFQYYGNQNGDFQDRDLPTDIELWMKRSARVMFLNNDQEGRWINGTLGNVVDLDDDFISVKIDDGPTVDVEKITWESYKSAFDQNSKTLKREVVGSFTQYPLKLAWAITIHKSQGKTFDKAIIDVGWGTFAHGQMYVALSRCTSLNGLILRKPVRKEHIILDEEIVLWLQITRKEIDENYTKGIIKLDESI
jgi:ATP-dependent DNA helicase PIF1